MLERIASAIGEGLIALDADLRYVYMNEAAERLLGVPAATILGCRPEDVLPPALLAVAMPHVERARATGQPATYDLPWGDRWFENRLYPSADGLTVLFIDVTERRRAADLVERRDAMHRFLVSMLEDTRHLRDPDAVLWTWVQGLGQHLRVARCFFAEVDRTQTHVNVGRDYVDGVASLAGRHVLADFGAVPVAMLRRGETVVVHDVHTDAKTDSHASRAAFDSIGVRSGIGVPLLDNGRLVAILSVQMPSPRCWLPEEIALLERVAELTWFAVAHARTETALRESRDVLSLAMRGGRMGAWSRNLTTGQVWWSRELEEIFALPPGGFDGTESGFLAFVHEADRARLEAAIAEAIRTRTDYVVEFRIRHADGRCGWMDGRGRALYAEDGTPVWLFGIGIDITDRKASEGALEAARAVADADAERLRLAMAAARLGDWSWDAGTDLVTFSPRGAEIFGVPAGVPVAWAHLRQHRLHPEDAPRAQATVDSAIASRGDYAIEYRLRGEHERERWVSIRGRARFDSAGRLVGMLGVIQDISHDRLLLRLDDAVRGLVSADDITSTAARMLGRHLGVPRCAYAAIDIDSGTFTVSADFADGVPSLAGRYPLATLGTACVDLLADGEPVVTQDLSADDRVPSTGREALSQAHVGGVIVVPIVKQGRLVAALGVHATETRQWQGEDVELVQQVASRYWESLERARAEEDRAALLTRERLARQQAEEQNRRLALLSEAAEAASRAKDEFLAMLGHELRNPLAPIQTALQLMRLRGDAGSERERVVIERQVKHLTRLVDDLLDVSRIARGKVELKLASVETAEVVARAIEMASPLLEQRTHSLDVDVPRAGLPLVVDAARLSQVVANLLTNAAKYTPPGGRISILGFADGPDVVVSVRDTGIGMTPDVLPTVFDLFVQGRQASDRAEGGLGLGLTIVRNLVQQHGGRVSAHSDGPGCGSEFVVRVPRAPAQARPVRGVASGSSAGPLRKGGQTSRVLVVDDNEDAAEMLAHVLGAHGHQTRVAHDGVEALRVAEGFSPTAAFLDIGLPVMDGYELATRLRQVPGLEDILLIAVTGYGQESDRRRSRAAGFQHHLVKPVDVTVLDALLA